MPANVGSLVATTLRNRRKEVSDTVTKHNALLARMQETGSIREYTQGGRTLFEPLIYGTNSSVGFYSDYDTFTPPTSNQDVIDGAEFSWRQLGGFVSIAGSEMVMNSGKFAAVDLLETRIKHLKAQLKNSFATSVYSNGTGSSGKEFGGLQLIIADNPAAVGTVGAIDQVANSFWRNRFSAAATFTTANALSRMNALYLQCLRGTDKPDLILADANTFGVYEQTQQQLQRFTDQKMGAAGFVSYKYKTADVVYDDQCPTNRMYMVNTGSIAFRYAPSRWFEVGDSRQVVTADYEVVPVWVMGNLTCNNRALNGVLIST